MLPQRILQDPRFFPRYAPPIHLLPSPHLLTQPTYSHPPTHPTTQRFIQVLRPKPGADGVHAADGGADSQWSGRLRQIYKKIEASEKRLSAEIEGVVGGGHGGGGGGEERLGRLEARMEGMEGKLEQILLLLQSAQRGDEEEEEEEERGSLGYA